MLGGGTIAMRMSNLNQNSSQLEAVQSVQSVQNVQSVQSVQNVQNEVTFSADLVEKLLNDKQTEINALKYLNELLECEIKQKCDENETLKKWFMSQIDNLMPQNAIFRSIAEQQQVIVQQQCTEIETLKNTINQMITQEENEFRHKMPKIDSL